MAEITVQKKKTNIWPWIVLGLIVLAVILYFVLKDDNNNNTAINTTDTTATAITADNTPQGGDAVASYIAFVQQDAGQMSKDHTYSSTALSRLIDAVQAKADAANYDVKADLDKARADANEITQNPEATDHADKIKNAADIISKALQDLQNAKYPSLSNEATDVKNAANGIKPNTLTLNQQDAIQTFFEKAASMLQKM